MKYIDEYRDVAAVRNCARKIAEATTQPWTIMEVCGGQTHAIVRHGLDQLLPDTLTIIHGPGCPVCVTPIELIDTAIQIASMPDTILCSFGDMLRVPGSDCDLLAAKAQGGDVRIVYSPLDALQIATEQTDKQVVFFAVGFETTAPANAMAVYQAHRRGIKNFSLVVSHVLVPPALRAVLASPNNRIQAFLAPGHVCTIEGYEAYEKIADEYHLPVIVTGFEPLDILQGVLLAVEQLEQGRAEIENPYVRVVQREGNVRARKIVSEVFKVVDRAWRGIGVLPDSGLALRSAYQSYDAVARFDLPARATVESTDCISGQVLQGLKKPDQCPAFGKPCTPEKPLGAPMVSSEGACAAYYRYRRHKEAPGQH